MSCVALLFRVDSLSKLLFTLYIYNQRGKDLYLFLPVLFWTLTIFSAAAVSVVRLSCLSVSLCDHETDMDITPVKSRDQFILFPCQSFSSSSSFTFPLHTDFFFWLALLFPLKENWDFGNYGMLVIMFISLESSSVDMYTAAQAVKKCKKIFSIYYTPWSSSRNSLFSTTIIMIILMEFSLFWRAPVNYSTKSWVTAFATAVVRNKRKKVYLLYLVSSQSILLYVLCASPLSLSHTHAIPSCHVMPLLFLHTNTTGKYVYHILLLLLFKGKALFPFGYDSISPSKNTQEDKIYRENSQSAVGKRKEITFSFKREFLLRVCFLVVALSFA